MKELISGALIGIFILGTYTLLKIEDELNKIADDIHKSEKINEWALPYKYVLSNYYCSNYSYVYLHNIYN